MATVGILAFVGCVLGVINLIGLKKLGKRVVTHHEYLMRCTNYPETQEPKQP